MALLYDYRDEYITSGVEQSDLEAAETRAINDVSKQGIDDSFYTSNMVICLVYIDLATTQGEAEMMQERIDNYRKEYRRYQQQANFKSVDQGVFTSEIGRA